MLASWSFEAGAEAPASRAPAATLELADDVVRATAHDIGEVELDGQKLAFAALATTPVREGRHVVAFEVSAAEATRLVLPPCAGKSAPEVRVDQQLAAVTASPRGQLLDLGPGRHRIELSVLVSGYEKRVACGFAPRHGALTWSEAGLRLLQHGAVRTTTSCGRCRPGQALVYVPRSVVEAKARNFPAGRPPLLVGLHPWNGAIETYAAYTELLSAAETHGVVLLFPDALGNSLYTERAEEEVMSAIDALLATFPVDASRISLFGASMGGAGATTIGFHRPDRFASITSLFGDSRYDLGTYVRRLLPNEAAARRVNALDVVDNARNLPVFLVHGDADKSSKIEQSLWLESALKKRGFVVRFDRKPGRGHEGALVSEAAKAIVERTVSHRSVTPSRITYRSVRAVDRGAYGLELDKRVPEAEAFVDAERVGEVVRIHQASGITAIRLAPGTFGAQDLPIQLDAGVEKIAVGWSPK